jgi:vacuolar iron transporter family protein
MSEVRASEEPTPTDSNHDRDEPHDANVGSRLNWLRAGVLGANDGIVSTAGVVVGVAGATADKGAIVLAGIAALSAGAMSMAAGEYVSVSSQSDSERALIAKERRELTEMPQEELAELVSLYERKGLSANTARQVAHELTERDALAAHLDAELNLDPTDIVSPWRAALASAVAFTIGGVLPLLAVLIFPEAWRIAATMIAVLVALAITGAIGARLGYSPILRPTIRVVLGGAIALAATFLLGRLVGTTGLV